MKTLTIIALTLLSVFAQAEQQLVSNEVLESQFVLGNVQGKNEKVEITMQATSKITIKNGETILEVITPK